MHVAGLWRYPVKSLAGEPLHRADITDNGINGDRVVHVAGAHGPITGRTRHDLLTIPAHTGLDDHPHVAGYRWDSSPAANVIRAAAGPDAHLAAYPGPERFDVLNLLVATDGAVAEFGSDVRRLRPNLLIGGVPAGAEATWPGQALVIGDAVIGIHSHRHRCIVTSIDPDRGDQDLDIFRRIRRRFDNQLALNCWVIRPGTVHLGDKAALQPTTATPERLGGWILGAPYRRSSAHTTGWPTGRS